MAAMSSCAPSPLWDNPPVGYCRMPICFPLSLFAHGTLRNGGPRFVIGVGGAALFPAKSQKNALAREAFGVGAKTPA